MSSLKLAHILGLNARSIEYLKYNKAAGRRIANSKLLTKSTLRKAKLSTPRLYAVIRTQKDLDKFDFLKLPDDFVVKPNRGLGGEGIVVVESRGERQDEWITSQGSKVTVDDLRLHVADTLEGRFSMRNLADYAYIEERVRVHPDFEEYSYHGTPDIGVIVFNRVPVMAFLRLPTKESEGRANMFQGAIACGIDVASGTTTYAVQRSTYVEEFPETGKKLRGLRIPVWEEVMKLAIEAADAAGLGYMRADIVLQPSVKKPGKTIPKVLELNAQPGLKIQLANKAGLRRRLERVEGLEVESAEKGIRIAKELFGDRELEHLGRKTKKIKVFEEIELMDANGEFHKVKALVDTGAFRSSIDETLAKELGLLRKSNVLMEKKYKSALGSHKRKVVSVTFNLAGRKIETSASVSDRSQLKRPMLIGRRDLVGFVVGFD